MQINHTVMINGWSLINIAPPWRRIWKGICKGHRMVRVSWGGSLGVVNKGQNSVFTLGTCSVL